MGSLPRGVLSLPVFALIPQALASAVMSSYGVPCAFLCLAKLPLLPSAPASHARHFRLSAPVCIGKQQAGSGRQGCGFKWQIRCVPHTMVSCRKPCQASQPLQHCRVFSTGCLFVPPAFAFACLQPGGMGRLFFCYPCSLHCGFSVLSCCQAFAVLPENPVLAWIQLIFSLAPTMPPAAN